MLSKNAEVIILAALLAPHMSIGMVAALVSGYMVGKYLAPNLRGFWSRVWRGR